MTALTHPAIAESEQTCYGCPDQYEGRLVDGRWFYLRYRWGRAELGVGDSLDAAVDDTTNGRRVSIQCGDEYDGMFESDAQRDEVVAQLLAMHMRAHEDATTHKLRDLDPAELDKLDPQMRAIVVAAHESITTNTPDGVLRWVVDERGEPHFTIEFAANSTGVTVDLDSSLFVLKVP